MPTVNKNKQISGGALYSTDSDHILTTADQIYDEQKGCYVSEYDFSGNIKSVNGELPDSNGNVESEIHYYFQPQSGSNAIICKKGKNWQTLTQAELQALYTAYTNTDVDKFKKYKFYYRQNCPQIGRHNLNSIIHFIFLETEVYSSNRAKYIDVTLTSEGVLDYREINTPYIKNLQIINNNLVVTTNTTSENIPLPEGGKIDNISFDGSNLNITNKVVTLPEITLTAWNIDNDNTTTIKIVGKTN